ncbi:DUF1800 domain-containing protein [Porphyrobacter sp. CACIAM 03H1]|uniref:DUF1800 domain-containing protein n=1 Tax=Porphyrobacter sp. CACIAM 03H1 TaxID=2003315 RepID=UPI000B5A3C4B|nr:DUF1800 domain-containing protein [Porphyrobacter sp. CACIAM 03H1]ASJ90443.1 hypothetical protein CBR61_05550 [Porphyrobacter sp. CACIAM 03H1]
MYLPGDDKDEGRPAEAVPPPALEPIAARAATVSTLAMAVAACGGGGGSSGGGSTGGGPPPVATVRKPQTDAEAARFLLQASLSVSTGTIAEVRSEGYGPWLDRQFAIANSQSARTFFADRGYDRVDASRFYNSAVIGDYMIWSQLLSGGNPVRKRIAFALSEFFVVSISGINLTWRGPAIGEYWDILNRHAFGNFRDLLQDITLNPAMGVFLNTRGNRAADARTGRVPDENYAREVMQLFTIGLFELNPDGTNRLSNGNPVETYGSADVTGLARVFTGYDFDLAGLAFTTEVGGTRQIPDPEYARRPMTADPARWVPARTTGFHSTEAKTFLGLTIPAGTGAAESLRLALDHLFNHPNVGPFFARQMIQRLVTSNPSPAYVGRVAAVFANNGQGRRGDLAAVFKAILTDNEALDPAGVTNPNFGKLREPVLRFVQFARTFGARSNSGNWQIGDLSDAATALGQSPLRSPSVFNFFRPGYFPTNTEIANRGLLAPEFQLVNETSVAGYVNFIERALTGGRAPVADLALDFAAEVGIAQDAGALLDRLDLLLTGRQLSSGVRDTIRTAMEDVPLTATSTNAERLRRVQIGVALILASTDYLIQK